MAHPWCGEITKNEQLGSYKTGREIKITKNKGMIIKGHCLPSKKREAVGLVPQLTSPPKHTCCLTFTVVQCNGLFNFCIAMTDALLERFCVGFHEMNNVHSVDLGEAFNEAGI
jgi:hypothetical protein